MRVVYLDVLFLINVILNYVILICTSRFGGIYSKRRKILMAAIIGGIYAAFAVIPDLRYLHSMMYKVIISMVMVYIGLGFKSLYEYLKMVLLFYAISFAFAGAAVAIYFFAGNMEYPIKNGIFYINISLRTLIISFLICYAIIGIFLEKFGKHKVVHKTLHDIRIGFLDSFIDIKALTDSGNDLIDYSTGKPVIVVERTSICQLMPAELLFVSVELNSNNTVDIFEKISKTRVYNRFRIINYSALGVDSGLLIAFTPDYIIKDGFKNIDAVIAISPNKISSGAYSALVGI